MNDEGKIKALCAVIEELLDLIQNETTADAFREDYQEVVSITKLKQFRREK